MSTHPSSAFLNLICQIGGIMVVQPSDAPHSRRRCIRNGHRVGENPSSGTWRDGRVVEYTGLENRHTVKGIWGSNPCLSAKADKTHSNCRDASSHYALLPFSITVVRLFLVQFVVVRIHEGQLN